MGKVTIRNGLMVFGLAFIVGIPAEEGWKSNK